MSGYGGGGIVQQTLSQLPSNLQWQPGGFGGGPAQQQQPPPGTGGIKSAPGGMGMPPQQMHQMRAPAFGGMGGYGAWPGQGYGGYPGRFGGGFMPGMGGMSNYGMGGGGFGMGGFSPWGYGPGSYNPYGAGSMGFGGGSGMYGGPFGGPQMGYQPFNANQWAAQQAGPMGQYQAYDPKKARPGTMAHPGYIQGLIDKAMQGWQRRQSAGTGEGGRCCFVAGTQVHLADGSDIAIEDVDVGDKLLGQDGAENVVLELDQPELGQRKLYGFNNGKPFVTAEHPFMTSTGWKSIDPDATAIENADLEVDSLQSGDYLETSGSVMFGITKIDEHDGDPAMTLYNFKLSGNNTYYADGFLVHNKGGDNGGGDGPGGGSGCFAYGTVFEMADGTRKEIQDISIGDEMLEGNRVTAVIQGDGTVESWFDYDGVHVTGGHPVWEDGKWIRVQDSAGGVRIEGYDVYYTVANEQHYMVADNGVRFTDYFEVDLEDFEDELLEKLNSHLPPFVDRQALLYEYR